MFMCSLLDPRFKDWRITEHSINCHWTLNWRISCFSIYFMAFGQHQTAIAKESATSEAPPLRHFWLAIYWKSKPPTSNIRIFKLEFLLCPCRRQQGPISKNFHCPQRYYTICFRGLQGFRYLYLVFWKGMCLCRWPWGCFKVIGKHKKASFLWITGDRLLCWDSEWSEI